MRYLREKIFYSESLRLIFHAMIFAFIERERERERERENENVFRIIRYIREKISCLHLNHLKLFSIPFLSTKRGKRERERKY